jgi:hypothetical protein
MNALRVTLLGALILSAAFATAANPTPFVNQPLIPASIAPGGPDFTLTVNGTGFVSGSTVNWNGSPRATTFVSGSQLTATILSSDIATAATASVTVSSPAPGGGVSNVVFLPVRSPASFVSLNSVSFGTQLSPVPFVVADFNKDGIQDMAVYSYDQNNYAISTLLGNGDGTFHQSAAYKISGYPLSADLNHDGNLDLIAVGASDPKGFQSLGVLLGNGDGTFQPPVYYEGPACCQSVLGDFNRDGTVDVLVNNSSRVCIFTGNGDGSFQLSGCTDVSSLGSFYGVAMGDFNADGKLDVALGGSDKVGNGAIAILLGNGDGTFQPPQGIPFNAYVPTVTTADFNGDGKLDLVVAESQGSAVSILLGNGDGTFQPPSSFATALFPGTVIASDMNGDGRLDLLVGDYGLYVASISVLLGNGDGTFEDYTTYDASGVDSFAGADFNNDGKLDVAVTNGQFNTITILTQDDGTVVSLSTDALTFPIQLVNSVSDPKLITLTNTGADPIKISKISTTSNFSQLSNCKGVQPGKSCKIGVFFTPSTSGDLIGYMTIFDDAGGSPQIVNLSGTATVVSFSPSKLDFGGVPVGKVSTPQNVLLTNEGNSSISITGVGIGGQNSKDFLQINACPNKLPAGASCTIAVYFHPTAQGSRNAILGVKDSGGGSPQKVPLTGTGT